MQVSEAHGIQSASQSIHYAIITVKRGLILPTGLIGLTMIDALFVAVVLKIKLSSSISHRLFQEKCHAILFICLRAFRRP
jgi:hypothetical protein